MIEFTDNFPHNIEAPQKLYIQYSHDIDFNYSDGRMPDGTEPDWDWEEQYIPIEHKINGRTVGRHVFMRIKVGEPSYWTIPIAISNNVTNIDTVVSEFEDDGVTFSFTIKLTFTDGSSVESDPITIKNGADGTKIETAVINEAGYLILTYDDGTVINAGMAKGEDATGIPPNAPDDYLLSTSAFIPVWITPLQALNNAILVSLPIEYDFLTGTVSHNNDDGSKHPPAGGDPGSVLITDGVGNYTWELLDTTLKSPDEYDAANAGGLYPTTWKGRPVEEGDTFYMTSAGTLGTLVVNIGDMLVCKTDSPGQVDANWYLVESNRDQATETILGVAKLATQAITDAGTNDTDIITPLKLTTYLTNADLLPINWVRSTETYGDRLTPSAGIKELYLEENSQGLTIFTFKNTNDVDNYAATVLAMKGSGADFTNTLFFGNYNANYYIPSWAGKGVLATDNDLVLGAVGATSVINFQIGGTFTAPVDVFRLDNDLVLKTLTANYETLVLDDNDIPNKKYVDLKGKTTVGIGGEYATVQLALAAGKYDLELVSAVTETVDWGVHTKDINLYAQELEDLTISMINTSDLIVRATNINFNVTGSTYNFTITSVFHLTSCNITGDTSQNRIGGKIYGENIAVDIGTGGFLLFVYNVIGLSVVGIQEEVSEIIQVRIYGIVVDLTLSGAFGLGLELFGGAVKGVIGDGFSGFRVHESGVLRDAKDIWVYIRQDTLNTIINCTITRLTFYAAANTSFDLVDNCIIHEMVAPYGGGNINTLYGFKNIINTTFTFSDVHVIDDALNLQSCKVTNGNITIDASADKTVIIGCRTATSIVDNGTNTQLLANNLI